MKHCVPEGRTPCEPAGDQHGPPSLAAVLCLPKSRNRACRRFAIDSSSALPKKGLNRVFRNRCRQDIRLRLHPPLRSSCVCAWEAANALTAAWHCLERCWRLCKRLPRGGGRGGKCVRHHCSRSLLSRSLSPTAAAATWSFAPGSAAGQLLRLLRARRGGSGTSAAAPAARGSFYLILFIYCFPSAWNPHESHQRVRAGKGQRISAGWCPLPGGGARGGIPLGMKCTLDICCICRGVRVQWLPPLPPAVPFNHCASNFCFAKPDGQSSREN